MKKLVEITLSNGVIEPQQLASLIEHVLRQVPPAKFGGNIVVISGRLPVWAYASLTHAMHPFRVVATFEPRLGKAVVVASHDKNLSVGELLDVSDAEKVDVTF